MFNADGRVFAGRRIDTAQPAWQMPQGGIDEGEDVIEAGLRELEEETGTRNVKILDVTEDWLSYGLPETLQGRIWGGNYCGQKQKWIAVRFLGADSEIDLEAHKPEFSDWKWMELEALPGTIVDFKRPLYEKLVSRFRPVRDRMRQE